MKSDIFAGERLTKSMEKYLKTVFRVSLGYVKNVHDAEDITQNVFFKLYKRGDGFVSDEAEKAWLIRLAINESKNLLNSAWLKKRGDMDESLRIFSLEKLLRKKLQLMNTNTSPC